MRILGLTLILGGLTACGDKETDTDSTDDTGAPDDTDEPAADVDGDGYTADEDCNDNNSSINPGAAEICDGVDNNCDDQIDEGATGTFYADGDGDGYGDEASLLEACDQPAGYITGAGDCNDDDAAISPDAKEVCDGADNNCDGQIDEGVTSIFYVDADGDGYGAGTKTVEACEVTAGYSPTSDDCDDTDPDMSPGASEQCDGIDNDCDPTSTEEGTVSWSDGKTFVDLTAEFAKGTATDPIEVLLADAGDVTFCGGTWYVDIDIKADVNLYGSGAPGDNVLSGAGLASVLSYPSGVKVTSFIENLDLIDGGGFYDSNFGRTIGGGIRCQSSSTLILSDVTIGGADSGLGGGLFVDGCDISITDSEIYENAAEYGAGMFIYSGTVDITDSQIWGNVADYTGGGAALEGASGTATLDLVDTVVTGNEGYYGAGLSAIYDSTITCTGTSAGKLQAAVTDNYNSSGIYGGGLLTYYTSSYTASVTVSDCDFGEDKFGDDNDPNDVYSYDQSASYTDYGSGASFICDYSGCK
jgi:hypothetical protein